MGGVPGESLERRVPTASSRAPIRKKGRDRPIDRDGKKIGHDNEGERSRPIMREFEKEYGLYRVEKGKEREEDVRLDLGEMKKSDYPRGDVKARVSSVVRNAAGRYRNPTRGNAS